ncbi:MAG: FAD-dependent oxidoreductase, partial [Dehalococcoidales bacterium]|nr:FAD-dependent oxidoreductase [Dehalococcoidales bacterium]
MVDQSMRVFETDVLVIGGGAAGCFAAIKAKENGANRVVVIDKATVGKSGCSAFGAGVLRVFIPEEDDFDLWFELGVKTGTYLNDQEWLETHFLEIYNRIEDMVGWGVEFERTPDGRFKRIFGRGCSPERPTKMIMFHGPQMMDSIAKKVRRSNIKVFDKVRVTDVLTNDGRVVGAVGFDSATGEFVVIKSRATVLVAGGQGFKTTFMGQKMVTGDAQAMAYRAGCELMSYEFTQNHTCCAWFDTLGLNMLMGSGGILVNGRGHRFMPDYDAEYKERAPLEVLAGAMACEVASGRGPIYMDLTGLSEEQVERLFRVVPLVCKIMERSGVIVGNRVVKKMEWVASFMGNIGRGGGIRINLRCETNLPGLYSAGDAACTMPAGPGGLGGTALPFALTSGARAGHFAADYAASSDDVSTDDAQIEALRRAAFAPLQPTGGVDPEHVILAVQETIFPADVFILRSAESLRRALAKVEQIRESQVPALQAHDLHYLGVAHEAVNLALTAEMYLRSALERRDSRGSHIRLDYPYVD